MNDNKISKEQAENIICILHKAACLLTKTICRQIFKYGDGENSGDLMYDRFYHDYKKDIVSFYLSLCEIDRAKFYRFIFTK